MRDNCPDCPKVGPCNCNEIKYFDSIPLLIGFAMGVVVMLVLHILIA